MKDESNNLHIVDLFLLTLTSCEDNEVTLKSEQENRIAQSKNLIGDNPSFKDFFTINNGVLRFKDKASFDLVTDYAYKSNSNMNSLINYLKKESFNNMHSFYENITEDDLKEVFETHNVPENLTKYFELVPDNNGYLDLEEKIRETFLQLYFNRELSFKIGDDFVEVKNDKLILRKANGHVSPLVGTNSKKGARLNGVLDGNHYFANPATNSAQWQNFGSGVYQNIDKVIHPAGYINSYNATAWCIGHDGGTHFVSTSETN